MQRGFFAAVDAPPQPRLLHRPRTSLTASVRHDATVGRRRRGQPDAAAVRTGRRAHRRARARVIGPLVDSLDRTDVRVLPVVNEFFGGNTGVTGLMIGADVSGVLADEPDGHRYLLPDVCLSDEGRFLDGITDRRAAPPRRGRATDGISLRNALNEH